MSNKVRSYRWKCERDGCYLRKCVLKFDVFRDCFASGTNINFSDIDAEVDVRGHFLCMEWVVGGIKAPGQERLLNNKSRLADPDGYPVVCILVDGNPEDMEVNRWKIIVRGKSTDWKESGISELKTYIVSWANWAMLNPVKGA